MGHMRRHQEEKEDFPENAEHEIIDIKSLNEGHLSNLALFASNPVDGGIKSIMHTESRPHGSWDSSSPIEFIVSNTSSEYIDFKRTRLYMKARIKRYDKEDLTPADLVTFTNAPLHSFFKQVEVKLNHVNVTNGVSGGYAYKAFIDLLTSFPEDVKETQLQTLLYTKDSKGHMDEVDPVGGQNMGLSDRYEFTKNGSEVDMEGTLRVDLADQERYMLNNLKIQVILHHNSDEFRLMCERSDADKYYVDITDIKMKFCKVRCTNLVTIGHKKALEVTPAIYPIKKSVVKTHCISAGDQDCVIDDVFGGRLPSKMIIGIVNSQAYIGRSDKNPYNFANYDLKQLEFNVMGTSIPGPALKLDYANNRYVTAYTNLFTGARMFDTAASNYISRNDFPAGYALYYLDLDGHSGSDYTNRARYETSSLTLTFKYPLQEAVTVIAYGKYDATIMVNGARSVRFFDEPI